MPHPATFAASLLPPRPTWRGWIHLVAFVVAMPASVVLLIVAKEPSGRVAAAIYAASLLALFGTSAIYHRGVRSERANYVMQRLDHSMIYVLITGTYVPICVVALPPEWGIPILSFVTAGAIVGITLKVSGAVRLAGFASALYPVLGWTAVVASPILVDRLTPLQFVLVILGGVVYTVGFPVLMFRRPNPWPTTFGYHEIWHACTVVAAVLHFIAVAAMVGGSSA